MLYSFLCVLSLVWVRVGLSVHSLLAATSHCEYRLIQPQHTSPDVKVPLFIFLSKCDAFLLMLVGEKWLLACLVTLEVQVVVQAVLQAT